jgi:UDP-hydrolysing UDP-N-acetyl-D-glucosamine 2-epimerase
MSKRRIAVITGTRAEYGLLYWTMRELQQRDVELQLVVTGAHLSPEHGLTVRQIEADGFPIATRVDMHLGSDRPIDIVHAMGRCISGIGDALTRLQPHMVVILGDRYEMLAAASAAAMLQIPIAHIHGGEVTEGALDESIRHAITKLSYWHFATTKAYARRIVQLGEQKSRVFAVGAPGVDNIVRLNLLSRSELEKELGIALKPPVILFTYHPETLSAISLDKQVNTVVSALRQITDATLIITGANADTGGRVINQALQSFARGRGHTLFHTSFGSKLYLSVMREAAVVAGNSSSGLIEAPAMGRATVNVGDRQKGRLRTAGVIDCRCDTNAIARSLRRALSPAFQKKAKPSQLFGTPGKVGIAIADKLTKVKIPATPRKAFQDK